MTKNAPNPTFKTDGLLLRFLQLMRFAMSGALNGCVAGIRPPLNSVVRWQSEVGIVMKDNSTQSWDRIADDWARHADTNDYRNLFLMPVTFELLGDVSGKNILDLGCGEGAYCRAFTKRGAYVTGIDGSERLINIAKARTDESITFLVRNANCLDGIEVDSFDIVLALMSLMDIEDYKGSISEVYRVLKKGGLLLMSILHPCFSSRQSRWKRNEDGAFEYYQVDAYFERQVWEEHITDRFRYPVLFRHMPLADFINPLIQLGFRLTRFHEPVPTDKQIQASRRLERLRRIPLFLFMEWEKQ